MAFDLSIWKQKVREQMQDWKPRMQRAGVKSVYAFLSAAALWPVVEAAQAGEWAALAVLGNVLAGVGGNLLANRVQNWKDEADAARQIAADVSEDPALRVELDTVLEKLEALPLAGQELAESDRQWFAETLREELGRLGNLGQFQAVLSGSGALVQGTGAVATGERGIGAKDFRGVAVTGDQNVLFLTSDQEIR